MSPWAAVALGLVWLCACQSAPTAPANGKLRVVATHSILADLVRNVAGDAVQLTVLVGPNSDVHSYEPSPGDSRALADADLIFENGLKLENWLDALVAASGSRARRVVAAEGVTPLGAADPHIWQSVPNAMRMTQNIERALSEADPAHAAAYHLRAADYLRQLADLHAAIQARVSELPAGRRKLVTNHDALGYFAHEYGFVIVGDVLGALSTEGTEPSAAQIAQLTQAIRAQGVPALFAENVENLQVIQQIAQEAGVKVGPPLYTDALGPPGSAGETYLKMMRFNAAAIVDALK